MRRLRRRELDRVTGVDEGATPEEGRKVGTLCTEWNRIQSQIRERLQSALHQRRYAKEFVKVRLTQLLFKECAIFPSVCIGRLHYRCKMSRRRTSLRVEQYLLTTQLIRYTCRLQGLYAHLRFTNKQI